MKEDLKEAEVAIIPTPYSDGGSPTPPTREPYKRENEEEEEAAEKEKEEENPYVYPHKTRIPVAVNRENEVKRNVNREFNQRPKRTNFK